MVFLSGPWIELDQEQEAHSTDMASLRVSVEWSLKEEKPLFPRLDFKRKLKIEEGLVAQRYRAAVFLWNICYSLYGGQTTTFFKCTLSRVERYQSVPSTTTVRKTVE